MKRQFVHISLAKACCMGMPAFNRMGLFNTWTEKDAIPTMAHSSSQVDRVKRYLSERDLLRGEWKPVV